MIPLQMFLSFLFFVLFEFLSIATSTEDCPVSICGSGRVPIRFPFQIKNSIARCVYPGFELSCIRNQTILTLPLSGPFVVLGIDYNIQTLYVNDPEKCLPKRFLRNFSVENSPFYPDILIDFTFLNCTAMAAVKVSKYRTIPCLSGENYTVWSLPTKDYDESRLPPTCEKISNVVVPVSLGYWSGLDDDIRLTFSDPFCGVCEDRGQRCGFKSDTGLNTECFDLSSSGMSRGTKYGIIIGLGIPGALCVIGIGCYLCGKIGSSDHRVRHRNTELSPSITLPPPFVITVGLDRPTIESYPKTLLGESGRLPNPNDSTCPICLSEYQPKETLRTIPECNHFFHADCIDKWLRMNASCPLCRNSPESTTAASGSSSLLSP